MFTLLLRCHFHISSNLIGHDGSSRDVPDLAFLYFNDKCQSCFFQRHFRFIVESMFYCSLYLRVIFVRKVLIASSQHSRIILLQYINFQNLLPHMLFWVNKSFIRIRRVDSNMCMYKQTKVKHYVSVTHSFASAQKYSTNIHIFFIYFSQKYNHNK